MPVVREGRLRNSPIWVGVTDFCPHLSLYCSLRGCCYCSLGGLTTCETVPALGVKGFTRCWKQPPREGWHKRLSTAVSIPAHPWVPVTQHLQLFSFARSHGLPADTSQCVTWKKIKHQQSRLENAFRKGSPGKCQGHPPLSCRFQQAADSVQEAAAGEGDVDALYVSAAAALRLSSPAANC